MAQVRTVRREFDAKVRKATTLALREGADCAHLRAPPSPAELIGKEEAFRELLHTSSTCEAIDAEVVPVLMLRMCHSSRAG